MKKLVNIIPSQSSEKREQKKHVPLHSKYLSTFHFTLNIINTRKHNLRHGIHIHATHVALHYITCTQNVHGTVVYLIWKVKVSKRWNISGGFVCHAMPTMSLVWSSGPLGCCFYIHIFLWFQARNTCICHTATHTITQVSEHFFC